MTSHDAPAPGTVAEEAALLVDLLAQRGWGGSSRMPSGSSSGDDRSAGTADTADPAYSPSNGQTDGHAHDHAHGATSDGPTGGPGGADGAAGSRSGCTCGGTTPAACRVCPVCQLIAFVQQVNPDTIDRVADFVGFAATALRDLATAQRERRPDTSDVDNDPRRPEGH